eukprot:g22060.t1
MHSPWVDGLTIGQALRETARRFPDADAVVFPALRPDGERQPAGTNRECFRLSYRQFDDAVDRVARALIGIGVQKGEHVAVWATNWPRWVLLQYATARIGAVMVTVNPAYKSSELSYVLKQSDAAVLFLIEEFRRSRYFEILNGAVPELAEAAPGPETTARSLDAEEFPKLRHVVSMQSSALEGMWTWGAFLELAESCDSGQLADREADLSAGEPINIQYTSGTTGFPKGAMLTHRNLLLNAYYIGDCQRISEVDRICVPVPFYHCFGCVLGVLCCGVYGAAMIVPADYFDAGETIAAIECEQATAIYGVPTMFIAQLEHPSYPQRDLTSLRTGFMAGSPCPIELMKRVVDDMGAEEITIAYGLTEASPVITQTRTDDPLEYRVQTVGRPIPDIEVKLVDPESGATLGDNEQGELCTRGHVVMLGYYNMPEQTASAIDADGWLHTGDLALRQPNGYYRITGRIKDMICRGGENIYPREIEEFLYTHPAVEDVAVVGVPDRRFVETVAAWIKLKEGATATEAELRSFCTEQMSHFKVPQYIKLVTAFPQTVTANVKKVVLKSDTVIGRSADCNLRIASNEISRRHCRVTVNDTGVFVRDLGSSNGTFINGNRIEPEIDVAISPESELSLGGIRFVVRFKPPEIPQPTDEPGSTVDLPFVMSEAAPVEADEAVEATLADNGRSPQASTPPQPPKATSPVARTPVQVTPPGVDETLFSPELAESETVQTPAPKPDESAGEEETAQTPDTIHQFANTSAEDTIDMRADEVSEVPIAKPVLPDSGNDDTVFEPVSDFEQVSDVVPGNSKPAAKGWSLFGMFKRKRSADQENPASAEAAPAASTPAESEAVELPDSEATIFDADATISTEEGFTPPAPDETSIEPALAEEANLPAGVPVASEVPVDESQEAVAADSDPADEGRDELQIEAPDLGEVAPPDNPIDDDEALGDFISKLN